MNVNDTNDLLAQARLIERIETLVKALDAAYLTYDAQRGIPNTTPVTFALDRSFNGRRNYRIVMQRGGKTQSVHAFVDKDTGDLLKAAGFKAPAKGARGNLLDDEDFARILRVCDWSGSYLYVR